MWLSYFPPHILPSEKWAQKSPVVLAPDMVRLIICSVLVQTSYDVSERRTDASWKSAAFPFRWWEGGASELRCSHISCVCRSWFRYFQLCSVWSDLCIKLTYACSSYKTEKLTMTSDRYRDADKSLARPGRTQATATEDLTFIYPIYYHNWGNISTIYIYSNISTIYLYIYIYIYIYIYN